MPNYRMLLQYDGTRYAGWQKQGNTDRTIQGTLEPLLRRVCEETVEVAGAGRTDAGVHAAGQVANFQDVYKRQWHISLRTSTLPSKSRIMKPSSPLTMPI